MSTSTKDKYDAKDTTPADPRDVELAELRQRLDTQEAALGRLQEIATAALKPCPCGNQRGDQSSFSIWDGTLYCSSGHHQWYGSRAE
jgi:hypothetical protein